MPTYKISFEKSAVIFLEKQTRGQRIRLYKAIYQLPNGIDIKKMKGKNNLYRLRVGNYRILYTIDHGIKLINIKDIDNRGDVYKGSLKA